MLTRRSVILLSGALALSATALRSPLYDMGDGVARLDWHVRMSPLKNVAARCSLLWNCRDDGSYTALAYTMPPRLGDDPHLGMDVEYCLFCRKDGRDSVLSEGTFPSHYPTGADAGFSAVIAVDGDGAAVALGGKSADFRLKVPFSRFCPGSLCYSAADGLKELRNDIRISHAPAPQYSRFATVDSLMEYISASRDPMEAVWSYLDRDMKPGQAHLGGKYRLATVAESPGNYVIIYLGGAVGDIFRPLQLKGRLKATPFTGHYDLVWYDAGGNCIDNETSATLEVNNLVLRLAFPIYGASLRFQRCKR